MAGPSGCWRALVLNRRSVQFCTDSASSAGGASGKDGARGNGRVAHDDAQRYRMNAAQCLSAAERCGPAYRDLTICMAETWLALARHQDAMEGLLAVWSEAGSATAPIQCPREPSGRRIAALPAREAVSA
jgi:hypothetical protein